MLSTLCVDLQAEPDRHTVAGFELLDELWAACDRLESEEGVACCRVCDGSASRLVLVVVEIQLAPDRLAWCRRLVDEFAAWSPIVSIMNRGHQEW